MGDIRTTTDPTTHRSSSGQLIHQCKTFAVLAAAALISLVPYGSAIAGAQQLQKWFKQTSEYESDAGKALAVFVLSILIAALLLASSLSLCTAIWARTFHQDRREACTKRIAIWIVAITISVLVICTAIMAGLVWPWTSTLDAIAPQDLVSWARFLKVWFMSVSCVAAYVVDKFLWELFKKSWRWSLLPIFSWHWLSSSPFVGSISTLFKGSCIWIYHYRRGCDWLCVHSLSICLGKRIRNRDHKQAGLVELGSCYRNNYTVFTAYKFEAYELHPPSQFQYMVHRTICQP